MNIRSVRTHSSNKGELTVFWISIYLAACAGFVLSVERAATKVKVGLKKKRARATLLWCFARPRGKCACTQTRRGRCSNWTPGNYKHQPMSTRSTGEFISDSAASNTSKLALFRSRNITSATHIYCREGSSCDFLSLVAQSRRMVLRLLRVASSGRRIVGSGSGPPGTRAA
jgi:hypothetical protein